MFSEFLGIFWVLQCPPRVQKQPGRWIGDTKLPLGVSECVNGTQQWTGVLIGVNFLAMCSVVKNEKNEILKE